jgi:hypothetical protein
MGDSFFVKNYTDTDTNTDTGTDTDTDTNTIDTGTDTDTDTNTIDTDTDTNFDESKLILNEKYINKILKMLSKLEYKITKLANKNATNDDIKILIESECTKYNCFPMENTISYQHIIPHIQCDESKYIVTNHKKYYDENDLLIVPDDVCFDLEENEVYTINLTVIPNNKDEKEHVYTEWHSPHIYRYNEYFYNFKLDSSKKFYSQIKKNHEFNAFSMINYKDNVKYRIGLKESLDNGILNSYPILYHKEKYPIIFKKFTIIIGRKNAINLNNMS